MSPGPQRTENAPAEPQAAHASLRRGACPSLAAPMQTGDGLLVRLRPKRPGLPPSDYVLLAQLAAEHGNGLLEVTARGNLQIRGLRGETVPLLAAALVARGIDFHRGVAVETPALAGLDPQEIADAAPLAARIRDALGGPLSMLRLAPKLSIVVDGGGRLNLADMVADIRLDALRGGESVFWRISVGGDASAARAVATVADADALAALTIVLKALDAAGPAARGRNLDIDRLKDALAPMEAEGRPGAPPSSSPSPIGRHEIGMHRVLGIGLPYGAADAASLQPLMRGLSGLGVREIRLSSRRALLALGLSEDKVEAAAVLAEELGFWTRPDTPGNAIAVCAGSAGCASASFDTKAVADLLTASVPDLLDGSMTIHISGCPKGCAHPRAAGLALCGRREGIGLVLGGLAGDTALATLTPRAIGSVMKNLAAKVRERRLMGETAHRTIERLGADAILDAVHQGRQ